MAIKQDNFLESCYYVSYLFKMRAKLLVCLARFDLIHNLRKANSNNAVVLKIDMLMNGKCQ